MKSVLVLGMLMSVSAFAVSESKPISLGSLGVSDSAETVAKIKQQAMTEKPGTFTRTSRIHSEVTCQDSSGRTLKSDDIGYEGCLNQATQTQANGAQNTAKAGFGFEFK